MKYPYGLKPLIEIVFPSYFHEFTRTIQEPVVIIHNFKCNVICRQVNLMILINTRKRILLYRADIRYTIILMLLALFCINEKYAAKSPY